jgi:small conductance mechanosensitive channel
MQERASAAPRLSLPADTSSRFSYVILGLAVAISLIALGVSATTVSTVIIILIALIGLALQQSLANFAATVIFLMFQPFKRGELVETMGYMGTVQEILLFNTVLLLPNQRLVSLPNSKVQESRVVNYTRKGHIWSDFSLTVDYGEDLSRVREVITEIVANDHRILRDPPFAVVVDELGENGVRLLVFPTVRPRDYWDVRNELRGQIKARFDAEGIRFSLPQRDVHLAPTSSPREVIDADSPSHH